MCTPSEPATRGSASDTETRMAEHQLGARRGPPVSGLNRDAHIASVFDVR